MRSTTTLMKNWQFTGPDGKTVTVDLPHTWNNIDGQDGGNDYWRGSCTYKTSFAAPAFDPAAQQVWLQFEGVGDSAKVSLNGTEIANHDGGFSTFRADITALLKEQNELTVIADNSKNDFVYPQKADFTFYGGIYRTVSLLVVSKDHIALDHLGGPGVQITPTVQGANADIRVETRVSGEGEVAISILDAEGREVLAGKGGDTTLTMEYPHLWDGIRDPYLYTCVVRLMKDGEPYRMSKRTGKSITLSDLTDLVPIDAARFFFNMREPNSTLDFDLDLAVEESSQNPVYYVQYAHARICSILKNLTAQNIHPRTCTLEELQLLSAPEEKELIRKLAQCPQEIINAAKNYDPARMTHYLMDVATLFHKFYNACRVQGEDEKLMQARISLCLATRIVLANLLKLLKITAPESM